MRHLCKPLCLVLLLIASQQGAVVHELSHFSGVQSIDVRVDSGGLAEATEATCALCPVFAQVATPAFSHSFHIPSLVRVEGERICEPSIEAVDTATLTPRSRGPPSLS